jgi:hypothetical protein
MREKIKELLTKSRISFMHCLRHWDRERNCSRRDIIEDSFDGLIQSIGDYCVERVKAEFNLEVGDIILANPCNTNRKYLTYRIPVEENDTIHTEVLFSGGFMEIKVGDLEDE